jgi:hypothetical protein
MRKLLGISVVLAIAMSAPASAQLGPRDGTNNVASGRIGMPSANSDALTEYQNRRALNDLPGQRDSRALAAKLGPARPAKKSELAAGAPVNDNTGSAMAKIEQIDPDGVIVSMGAAKVKVPAEAFGHNKAGLTTAQFQAMVAKANGS